MLYDISIREMQTGDELEGFYVLSQSEPRMSKTNKPYLSGKLSDSSGDMEFKAWDYAGPIGAADAGSIVKIRGVVGEYQGKPQLTVRRLRAATEQDEYDLAALVPVAPIDRDGSMEEIRALIASFTDEDYKALAAAMLDRHGADFSRYPAAKSMHHGFVSGLLMHTLSMLRLADRIAGLYPEVVDRDLLLTGTLLHDFAKAREFTLSPLGLVADYSPEGQLLGHLYMGAMDAARTAEELGVPEEKSLLVQHMIVSHHGIREYGAITVPATAEAELLSYLDLIDSRMEIYREQLADIQPGQFSSPVPALDRKRLYRHF